MKTCTLTTIMFKFFITIIVVLTLGCFRFSGSQNLAVDTLEEKYGKIVHASVVSTNIRIEIFFEFCIRFT